MRTLVAIPVYNEQAHVRAVLDDVLAYTEHVLMVDDGSTDDTPRIVLDYGVDLVRHVSNRGYGRSLRDAFRWAIVEKYDWLITMDCDEQHEPAAIPCFIKAARENTHDVISGSRYLRASEGDDRPPPQRQAVNATITNEINCRLSRPLGTMLTDSFCGYKAYRVDALRRLRPTVAGYAFPMQFWVQAAAQRLRVREIPVRRIYTGEDRTFGGRLDNADIRLRHYQHVLRRELRRQSPLLPCRAAADLLPTDNNRGCCPT